MSQGTNGEGNLVPYRLIGHEVGVTSQIWIAQEKNDAVYDPSADGAVHTTRNTGVDNWRVVVCKE